jgi:hypothetical protein
LWPRQLRLRGIDRPHRRGLSAQISGCNTSIRRLTGAHGRRSAAAGSNLPPVSSAIFRRIANAVLNRGAELLGSQLTRENGFLDYSLWGSLAYRTGLRSYGLDYFHDREEFAGSGADTIIGSVTFPVSARLDLEFRLGATDSDLEGMVSFVGLTLFAYLGG